MVNRCCCCANETDKMSEECFCCWCWPQSHVPSPKPFWLILWSFLQRRTTFSRVEHLKVLCSEGSPCLAGGWRKYQGDGPVPRRGGGATNQSAVRSWNELIRPDDGAVGSGSLPHGVASCGWRGSAAPGMMEASILLTLPPVLQM